jgi:RNA polymerase sigma-70 factor (ECF subfamily)
VDDLPQEYLVSFAGAAGGDIRAVTANSGVLAASLASCCARGRAAFPALAIDDRAFVGHLGRCAAAARQSEQEVRPDELCVEDLYLACACLLGVTGAPVEFIRRFGDTIRAAIAPLTKSRAMRDDAEQQLYEYLLVGRPGAPPKIGTYLGQAPLVRWVKVAAQRAVLMMLRSDRTEARSRDGAAAERVAASMHPESALVKRQYRRALGEALEKALGQLDDRERILLKLHYVSGLSVDKIGAMYGVSQSTASRWLEKARQGIVKDARQALRASHRLSTAADLETMVALAISQLDISLARLLSAG